MTNEHSRAIVEAGLAEQSVVEIGSRLRQRRRALKMTLRDVADAAGITEGYLSQLENDVHPGSIRTLQRVAGALKLTVSDLFAAPSTQVQRYSDNLGMSVGEGARKAMITPRSFDHLQAYLAVLEPGGSTAPEPYSHGASDELLIVLEGEVEVEVGGVTYRLGKFDSVTYSSTDTHRAVEAVGERATVMWAMAPPSF